MAMASASSSMLASGAAPWREHVLEELPCTAEDAGDAVTAVLHTILFTRAPGPVRPSEATCQAFPSVSYSLCAVGDVSRKVDLAVKVFEESIVQGAAVLGGPSSGYLSGSQFHYQQQQQPYGGSEGAASRAGGYGCLVVTFFERKVKKALFGLMSNEEKVVFEKWILPVNVASSAASSYGRDICAEETEAALQNALLHILAAVQTIDHIPNAMYDFEITSFPSLEAAQSESTYSFGLAGSTSVRLMG